MTTDHAGNPIPDERVVGHAHLTGLDVSPRLYNEDLAPTKDRHWGVYSLFCMWMSDVHSIGGYTFAAGLFFLGLSGYAVLAALVIGIFVVFGLMTLSGFAGQRLGVPYPVLARMSFGVLGANLPALVRAIIAIAFYGIQTWLASVAVVVLSLRIWPGLKPLASNNFLGLSTVGWIAFLLMWVLQLLILRNGMETVRRFQDWAGPAVWVVMAALAVYIVVKAHGNITLNISSKKLSTGGAIREFFSALALTVAYFSTLMLNFCDFSRFAPSRRAILRGNFWGLPVNFIAFAVVSVIVTAGSKVIYGQYINDPVEVVGRINNTVVLVLGAVTFAVATLGINVVANFVSPAYDLANVAPRYIDFKRGGFISAVVALIILPWKLYSSPVVINYFLGGLAAFLGPLFAIIMVDYYILRRQHAVLDDLYRESGEYYYRGGVNPRAIIAFAISATVAAIVALVPAFKTAAPFSWFIGAALGGILYFVFMPRPRPSVAPSAVPSTAVS